MSKSSVSLKSIKSTYEVTGQNIFYPQLKPGEKIDRNQKFDTWSVVSLFSGCGGMDLGFRGGFEFNGIQLPTLPFNILAAYDHDPKCVVTYNKNIIDHAETLDLSDYDPKMLPPAQIVIGGF